MTLKNFLCAFVIFCGGAAPALAQSSSPVIPGEATARPVPGAQELPDPHLDYKVVFVVGKDAPKAGEVNPALKNVSRYVNTLAAYGVPASHRHVAVVFHAGATDDILADATFKARHGGHDNPNTALIQRMAKAGVQFYVCGQAVLGKHIDPKTIMHPIELTLWALTTVTNLELRGYVRGG